MNQNKTPLQSIKGSLIGEHYYLSDNDKCFFIGLYNARRLSAFSEMNKLIINLKKPLEHKNQPGWIYKEKSMVEFAHLIMSLDFWERMKKLTWIPVPPSYQKNDPNYDDRLIQILKIIKSKNYDDFDYRELVLQKTNRNPAHNSNSRPRPNELIAYYSMNELLINPIPKGIIIFDDVLVTGASYKAMKTYLEKQFSEIPIYGFFLARNVWSANPDLK